MQYGGIIAISTTISIADDAMPKLMVFTLFTFIFGCVFAQSNDQSYQQQANQAQLRRLKADVELQRMQADSEKMQQNIQQMMDESERRRKADREELFKLKQSPSDNKEAIKKAADDIRDEISRSSTKMIDYVFLTFAMMVPILIATYIARKVEKEGVMKYEQKFGVVLMLCATLLSVAAIMISDNWFPNLDILQNIQLNLRIQLFAGDEYPIDYLINIATKYVLFILVLIAAYGYTSYLGITPVWRKSVKIAFSNHSENNT